MVTFEWQHCAPNYAFILENGIEGSLQKIARSRVQHQDELEKLQYLDAVEQVCMAILDWSEHCTDVHEQAAMACTNSARRQELLTLAQICRKDPLNNSHNWHF